MTSLSVKQLKEIQRQNKHEYAVQIISAIDEKIANANRKFFKRIIVKCSDFVSIFEYNTDEFGHISGQSINSRYGKIFSDIYSEVSKHYLELGYTLEVECIRDIPDCTTLNQYSRYRILKISW